MTQVRALRDINAGSAEFRRVNGSLATKTIEKGDVILVDLSTALAQRWLREAKIEIV